MKFKLSNDFKKCIVEEEYKDIIRLVVATIYDVSRFELNKSKLSVKVKNKIINVYYDQKLILSLNTL